ncbi:MAG: sulfotransferase [Myxococcota bacterium]
MADLFTAQKLIDAARRETGREDFGADAWRDGLEVILDSAAREAELNPIGREILRGWIHRRLVNRLRVIDWVAEHPEVRRERIEKPLVILGMLRTGTTILCELLACDPANRPLMKWEGLDCCPPPRAESFRSDPRIRAMVDEMENTYKAVPRLKAIHFEPGDGPTECVALLGQAFRSQDWLGLFHVPSYVSWYHACDMEPAYAYHRLALQLLQSRAPGRWSLKAPGHMLALDALFAVYPDARLIVTHRDPVKTVASSASLSFTSRPDSLSTVELGDYFGPLWLRINATMVDRMMEFRARHAAKDAERFLDLHYGDLAKDPIESVRRIYDHFGETLTPDAETAMRAHLDAHPKGHHGVHHYSLEAVGLAPEQVRERFSEYCARFDVPPEE